MARSDGNRSGLVNKLLLNRMVLGHDLFVMTTATAPHRNGCTTKREQGKCTAAKHQGVLIDAGHCARGGLSRCWNRRRRRFGNRGDRLRSRCSGSRSCGC